MKHFFNIKSSVWFLAVVLGIAGMLGNAFAQDGGTVLGFNLWCKAVLQTPSVGAVTLNWKEVGSDTTPSGDKVISGYFYADPKNFAYGSVYNPEVFVKIYIAKNGWANIAFNHVTVDNVQVYSAYKYDGKPKYSSVITLNNRLAEHTYNGVSITSQANYNGIYSGKAIANQRDCNNAVISLQVADNILTGTLNSDDGTKTEVAGTVSSSGKVEGVGYGDTLLLFKGMIQENTASGTWEEWGGCSGTWSATKK